MLLCMSCTTDMLAAESAGGAAAGCESATYCTVTCCVDNQVVHWACRRPASQQPLTTAGTLIKNACEPSRRAHSLQRFVVTPVI